MDIAAELMKVCDVLPDLYVNAAKEKQQAMAGRNAIPQLQEGLAKIEEQVKTMEDKLGEGFEEYGERLDSLESLSPRGECGLFKMDGVLSRLHENAKIHDFRGPGGEVG